jgi:hypothetical protein
MDLRELAQHFATITHSAEEEYLLSLDSEDTSTSTAGRCEIITIKIYPNGEQVHSSKVIISSNPSLHSQPIIIHIGGIRK